MTSATTATSTAGTTRTVTAFFESREAASRAVDKLTAAGFPRSDIRLVEGSTPSATVTSESREGPGIWEALKDLFLPDEDRYTYAEGLRRGGYLVSVMTTAANHQRALDILDDEGALDIDERAETWRKEGWQGYRPGILGTSTGTTASTAATRTGTTTSSASTGIGTTSRSATGLGTTGREETIPVVEEQLRVGKREVNAGRVRVRSYVIETPVSEQVNLRDEHVTVERRPVDRPLSGTENAFRERTIEAEERHEEPVVAKDARVKEEIAVKKDVGTRTETVSDTVRQTKVEVDDGRTAGGRSSSSGPVGTKPRT